MAHLVKLSDYVSRYALDLNHYPSQFTRFKKERWYYLKKQWEQTQGISIDDDDFFEEETNALTIWQTLKNKIMKRKVKADDLYELERDERTQKTLADLRNEFLQTIFESQVMWASSSLGEKSNLDEHYLKNEWLYFFCVTVPENYFLFFEPIVYIKNAELQLDIVLISPSEVLCITVLPGQELSVFEASSERFWIEYINKKREKRLSPLLSLTRMEKVIRQICLEEGKTNVPIRKMVLSPNSLIDNKIQGTKVEFIDKRNFSTWKEKLTKQPSPVKHDQLKLTELLLSYCQTKLAEEEDLEEEQEFQQD
ncbi:hypothetical protein BTS2_1140 [Bacillus sp. TS-2]|nr:hypothetical protein BTS2_1140 [Bacillus sp. TS-2]